MKRERYVHGWRGWVQCIYGTDKGIVAAIEPCSLTQAKKARARIEKSEQKRYAIYRLVEVKP